MKDKPSKDPLLTSKLAALTKRQLNDYTLKGVFKFGLLGGDSGLCILLKNLRAEFDEEFYIENMYSLINKHFNYINNSKDINFSFHNGLSGFYWLIRYLLDEDDSLSTYLEEMKSPLLWAFDNFIDNGNFDLLHGANGIMVSAVDQKNQKKFIDNYYCSLKKHAQYDKHGVLWPLTNSNVYNFGIAHGLSGILQVLSKYNSPEQTHINELILEISLSLINRMEYRQEKTWVPCAIPEGNETCFDEGLGWCFGRLSIAYPLLRVAKKFNNNKIFTISDRIIKESLTMETTFKNAKHKLCLCHGITSSAYMYKKIFDLTGDEIYRQKSVLLCEEVLKELLKEDLLVSEYDTNYSILSGFPGVFLAIKSIIKNEVSDWDSILLLD
ncbi:lanthionine synthetase LanC family protein [Pedobacter caeni]|uniref:Lanthionine synthetase C-like protein n=1 Tax=Pedobacter caeni TaxID=288992 RepID=A0A1M5EF54_9SPHI|nr:lanthionine synthetase LanC family protein [Pedobacter caeni]SHF77790.1 Lanthionine synthetase C-like protein [Pedobacter caeni]